jgi:hypothetical protein
MIASDQDYEFCSVCAPQAASGDKKTLNELFHATTSPLPSTDSVTISRECYWAYVPQEEYWQTSCEEAFALNEGSPEDNNFKHCCYCGGELKQAK